jgi:LacI family transcriptional regulator
LLQQSGQHLILTSMDDHRLTDETYVPKVLDQWACDGLLIHYTHRFPQRMLELIARYQLPSIWINTKLPVDCVYPDDFMGAVTATKRLIELGHRRIAYVNLVHAGGHYSEVDRRDGYEATMREAGLVPQAMTFDEDLSPTGGVEGRAAMADQVLSLANRPSAILCYETATAGPLLTAALRRGLKVPEELSIVTFGRMLRNDTGIALTTMLLPMTQVGARAAEMVLQKVAKPGQAIPAMAAPCQWSEGETCGPPGERT